MSFRFKEFTINQDRCAMKVSTDACLFGAYVAASHLATPQSVLDIGAGTGLLSLMLAQRFQQATFDAVELDEQAALQCQSNAAASTWASRIRVHATSIQKFQSEGSYDLIISNPPFFKNALASPNSQRQLARHQDSLAMSELASIAERKLTEKGVFWLLLPQDMQQEFRTIATGLNCNFWIEVEGRPNASSRRVIAGYQKIVLPPIESIITIQDSSNNYTNRFAELLFPYYIIF